MRRGYCLSMFAFTVVGVFSVISAASVPSKQEVQVCCSES